MSAKRFTYIVSCDLFHKLMFESSRVGWGKGFLKPNLPRTPLSSSPPPPTGGDKEKKESSCFGGPGRLLLPAAVLLGQI